MILTDGLTSEALDVLGSAVRSAILLQHTITTARPLFHGDAQEIVGVTAQCSVCYGTMAVRPELTYHLDPAQLNQDPSLPGRYLFDIDYAMEVEYGGSDCRVPCPG